MPQILRRLPCRKPAQSASTNLSRSRNIPSTNSEDAIRTASEEHVSHVPRLEPPRYSPTITRADDQHEAPTETSALIGGGCTTTGAPSDSHTGSRAPTVNCSVRPCGQSLLKFCELPFHEACLASLLGSLPAGSPAFQDEFCYPSASISPVPRCATYFMATVASCFTSLHRRRCQGRHAAAQEALLLNALGVKGLNCYLSVVDEEQQPGADRETPEDAYHATLDALERIFNPHHDPACVRTQFKYLRQRADETAVNSSKYRGKSSYANSERRVSF
ncbi:hypothetical protein HPB50_027803 [Hyalomma asiaticum]|nr:hypothetical protein HPB50_027803 [Hyalomma asiaticum]